VAGHLLVLFVDGVEVMRGPRRTGLRSIATRKSQRTQVRKATRSRASGPPTPGEGRDSPNSPADGAQNVAAEAKARGQSDPIYKSKNTTGKRGRLIEGPVYAAKAIARTTQGVTRRRSVLTRAAEDFPIEAWTGRADKEKQTDIGRSKFKTAKLATQRRTPRRAARRSTQPNGSAIGEYWRDTRMPMHYGEKVLGSKGAMARAAKSQGGT
jgi:hypothetical protein